MKFIKNFLEDFEYIRIGKMEFIMSQKLSPVAVGIDLGTNRYVISVIKAGGVEIVTNSGNYW